MMNWRQVIVHWTELSEDTSGSALAAEWNYYRRHVGRLILEGHERRWVIIKGENVIGIWDTKDQAFAVASERFFREDVFVKQILEWEPLVRLPHRWHLWRNLRSQS